MNGRNGMNGTTSMPKSVLGLICSYVSFFNVVGNFSNKNVNVTTIAFLMSGDLTGLCLYMLHLVRIN